MGEGGVLIQRDRTGIISCVHCRVIVLPAPIVKGDSDQEVRRYMAYCTKNKVSGRP